MDGIVKGIPKHSSKPIVDGIVTGVPRKAHPKLEVPVEKCTPGATRKAMDTFGSGLTPQGEGNLKGKSKK
jgi:hypothetical protein